MTLKVKYVIRSYLESDNKLYINDELVKDYRDLAKEECHIDEFIIDYHRSGGSILNNYKKLFSDVYDTGFKSNNTIGVLYVNSFRYLPYLIYRFKKVDNISTNSFKKDLYLPYYIKVL